MEIKISRPLRNRSSVQTNTSQKNLNEPSSQKSNRRHYDSIFGVDAVTSERLVDASQAIYNFHLTADPPVKMAATRKSSFPASNASTSNPYRYQSTLDLTP